jgi:2-iminoacetate synthase
MNEEEIRQEVKNLLDKGYRHITLIAAEHHSLSGIDYIEQAIKTIYETRSGDAFIQRVDVNCAPLSIEEYHRLKKCKIGTYQVFQETYHQETYRRMHPTGPKSFFGWRIDAIGRAIDAGIEDIAIGPLLGLFDWKFEVMATLMHALHLNEKYAIRPHSVSIQRLRPVPNAPMSMNPSFEVTDDDLKLIVAVLRLALPQTGIILSTNEAAELRDEPISIGISQVITKP